MAGRPAGVSEFEHARSLGAADVAARLCGGAQPAPPLLPALSEAVAAGLAALREQQVGTAHEAHSKFVADGDFLRLKFADLSTFFKASHSIA